MNQQALIAAPTTPAEWCDAWAIPLLEPIPHPGLATAKDMGGFESWPARNHPRAGLWLRTKYAFPLAACADPMFGVGALWPGWDHIDPIVSLAAVEIEGRDGVPQGDARTWSPGSPRDLVKFSPPFLQNHSSGEGEHQVEMRERKGLHAVQAFGGSPGNLGNMKRVDFWHAMGQIYAKVRTYTKPTGRMVVVLRNGIRSAREVDVIGEHLSLMRRAGWIIEGAHPRAVRPTVFQQMKVKRDPSTPWVKFEWAVVAR